MSTLGAVSMVFSACSTVVAVISICQSRNTSYVLPVTALALWTVGFGALMVDFCSR